MNPPHASSTLTPATLLQLQEEERYRLAQALMRGPGQILANALLEIQYSLPLMEKNPEMAVAGLAALRDELRDGLAQLKAYVGELQPPLLDEMGLGQAIRHYLVRFSERTGIRATCRGADQLKERYPATIEIALFRILQEALENVHNHSGATAVQVRIGRTRTHLSVTIQDNGNGFTVKPDEPPRRRQLGLIAMRDRAELLGGQLQVFSEPRRGVRVVVRIPYHGNVNLAEGQTGGQNETEWRPGKRRTEPQEDSHQTGQEQQDGNGGGASHRRKRARSSQPEQAGRF